MNALVSGDRRHGADDFYGRGGGHDGAHHVSAKAYSALNDLGFTVAGNLVAYWVGEAVGSKYVVNLDEITEGVTSAVDRLFCGQFSGIVDVQSDIDLAAVFVGRVAAASI